MAAAFITLCLGGGSGGGWGLNLIASHIDSSRESGSSQSTLFRNVAQINRFLE